MQRERILATVVAVYAAIVITNVFSPVVFNFFQGNNLLFNQVWVRANLSPFIIQTVMLVGIVALIVTRGGLMGGRAKPLLSPLEIIAYSFLNSALIASQILTYLPPEKANAMISQSKLLALVANGRNIWLLAPLVLMVIFGSRNRKVASDE